MEAIQRFIILSLLCELFAACTPRTAATLQVVNTTVPLDSVIALTHSASPTEPATVSTAQLQPVESTSTPYKTETPAYPLSYVYEGPTQRCGCENCYCVTNIVLVARITIDAQGHVSGVFDQYLADTPPVQFEGTVDSLHGLLELGPDKTTGIQAEKDEFSGTLSRNLNTLEGSILSTGTYIADGKSRLSGQRFTAKRTFVLFRK